MNIILSTLIISILLVWFIVIIIKLYFAFKLKKIKDIDNIIKSGMSAKIEGQDVDIKALATSIKEKRQLEELNKPKEEGFFKKLFKRGVKNGKEESLSPTPGNPSNLG